MKICLVAPYPPPYGGISHWTAMIKEMADSRSDVDIIIADTAPRWRSLHDAGVLKRSIGGAIQLIRDFFTVVSLLRRSKFDAIHMTTSGSLAVVRDFFIVCLSKIFKIPFVYHIRFGRIPEISRKRNIEWFLIKLVSEMAEVVIAIDEKTYLSFKSFSPKVNVFLVPNCIDLEKIPVKSSELRTVFNIVFVGWVLVAKGVSELVEAWSRINNSEWNLKIVGPVDGDYKEKLISISGSSKLIFSGELVHDDALIEISKSDIFVLPSYTEGFPNVILEAMALGRPIIATNVGAIPEMLGGGAGKIISPRNTDELVVAIETLMSDSSLRNSMGSIAKQRAHELYSLTAVFEKYMSIWQSFNRG